MIQNEWILCWLANWLKGTLIEKNSSSIGARAQLCKQYNHSLAIRPTGSAQTSAQPKLLLLLLLSFSIAIGRSYRNLQWKIQTLREEMDGWELGYSSSNSSYNL